MHFQSMCDLWPCGVFWALYIRIRVCLYYNALRSIVSAAITAHQAILIVLFVLLILSGRNHAINYKIRKMPYFCHLIYVNAYPYNAMDSARWPLKLEDLRPALHIGSESTLSMYNTTTRLLSGRRGQREPRGATEAVERKAQALLCTVHLGPHIR